MSEISKQQQGQPRLTVVVTSIQAPTASMVAWGQWLEKLGFPLLVVGDKKGPFTYPLPGAECVTYEQQLRLPFSSAQLIPPNHYSRKNLGYLLAMRARTECIYETDDDNAPLTTWTLRQPRVPAVLQTTTGWLNVYRQYSKHTLWPRGLPLDEIRKEAALATGAPVISEAPIQQGLANGSPDVDAVWRLVLDKPIEFEVGPSLALAAGTWCPFNSQSTWWWPEAYPLMYLPSYCSFRMTDIWRSFVAQRCLWMLDRTLVFHPPEVFQARNTHNLMQDFKDEIPGYMNNEKIRQILEALSLKGGRDHVGANLLCCYEALVREALFPKEELSLVKAWLTDMAAIQKRY